MKAIIFVAVISLSACAPAERNGIQEFIPGTYIRYTEHEFGKEWDTLSITVQSASANQYSIIRRWRYERVLDGQQLEPEYKTKLTSGVYEPSKSILVEQETGKLLAFNEVQGIVLVGTVEYRKLK